MSTFWSMHQTRKVAQTRTNKESLAMVLFKSMEFLAIDPKDHILGILGLVNQENAEMSPHYEHTVQDIYKNAVQWSVQEEKSFDLLYLSGVTHTRKISRLPSWVPDFSTDVSINPFGIPFPGRPLHYTAGGPLTSAAGSNIQFNDSYMIAQGVIIDTVEIFGHVRIGTQQERRKELHKYWSEWVRQAIHLVNTHHNSDDGLKAPKSLWRTLVADLTHTTREPAPDYYEGYFQSFKDVYIDNAQYHDLDWNKVQAFVANDTDISEKAKLEGYHYLFAFLDASIGRRLCITDGGRTGLVPSEVAKGDKICVLVGARAPFVIRETSSTLT